MNKCNHPEARNLECKWDNCPRGYLKGDWEDLIEEGCGYMRTTKGKTKK